MPNEVQGVFKNHFAQCYRNLILGVCLSSYLGNDDGETSGSTLYW